MAVASSDPLPDSPHQFRDPRNLYSGSRGRPSWQSPGSMESASYSSAQQLPPSDGNGLPELHPSRHYSPAKQGGISGSHAFAAWSPPRRKGLEQREHVTLAPMENFRENRTGELVAGTGSPDGALERPYKTIHTNTVSSSKERAKKPVARKKGNGVGRNESARNHVDENHWIHRDKLKEIETRELEEAGFKVDHLSRSHSRGYSAAHMPLDLYNSDTVDEFLDEERADAGSMTSPEPVENRVDERHADHTTWADLRTSEEIARERDQRAPQGQTLRPSTSRIPVAKVSAVSATQGLADRDQPQPRPPSGSGSGSWDAAMAAEARTRGGSISSQVLLDEVEPGVEPHKLYGGPTQLTSASSSPLARTPGSQKASSSPAGRRAGAQKSTFKPRTASGGMPAKRPATRSGSLSRPSTSTRPEGEAPWIATMYKPDPRLPPDQQIIPTHAKRMQQEQWEHEGKIGTMYDKDFRLQNTEEPTDKRRSLVLAIDTDKAPREHDWPLPSPTKLSPERTVNEPKSPAAEQSGYKLTPTIPQSPRPASRSSVRQPVSGSPPSVSKPNRIPALPDDSEANAKAKKGCCCIVM